MDEIIANFIYSQTDLNQYQFRQVDLVAFSLAYTERVDYP
jgi:hypothetical protein